jgi:hypothetical protein
VDDRPEAMDEGAELAAAGEYEEDDAEFGPGSDQHMVPAWFAARLFGQALNFEGGGAPHTDIGMAAFLNELGLEADSLSWPISSPATTTMADVLALRAAIVGQSEWPDHKVWSTLDDIAPSLGRACRSRGGMRNKLMAVAKACLTGHWMCALFMCAHCQSTASLIAPLYIDHRHTCSMHWKSMMMVSRL